MVQAAPEEVVVGVGVAEVMADTDLEGEEGEPWKQVADQEEDKNIH